MSDGTSSVAPSVATMLGGAEGATVYGSTAQGAYLSVRLNA